MNIGDAGFQFQRLSNQTVRQNQGTDRTDSRSDVSGNAKLTMAKEGKVFQGQVMDVQGEQVTIRMEDNALLKARLGEEVGLNIGDELSFQVKESDGSNVVIKPFLEGAEAMKDNAIFKVLEGNNLTPSAKNYQIAETLMNQNMSVDKASMQKIMQQSYKYPDASIDTLVSLNKMGIPVNEANIGQYESYMNNQHQIMQGMQELSDSMIEFASKEVMNLASGEEGLNFQRDFLQAISDPADMANINELSNDLSNELSNELSKEASLLDSQTNIEAMDQEQILNTVSEHNAVNEIGQMQEKTAVNQMINQTVNQTENLVTQLTDKLQLPEKLSSELVFQLQELGVSDEQLQNLVGQSENTLQLLNNMNELLKSGLEQGKLDDGKLKELLTSDSLKEILGKAIKDKFSLNPKEMKDPGEVKDIYKSLYEKSERLMQQFGNQGGSAGEHMKEQAKGMQERIDFMQNLSEMYAYAQLPVRVDGADHNTDLFVYMNKKRLQENKEDVSALLHLDMDHLGPTDVHVSLRGTVVHTKFYVEDEKSAKLIDDHMNSLEQAIAENGFTLTNEVVLREPTLTGSAPKNPVVDEVMGRNLEQSVKRYSFDVRT